MSKDLPARPDLPVLPDPPDLWDLLEQWERSVPGDHRGRGANGVPQVSPTDLVRLVPRVLLALLVYPVRVANQVRRGSRDPQG